MASSGYTTFALNRKLDVTPGQKVRGSLFGSWHRHDLVRMDGRLIGRIQVRNRYYGKRIGWRLDTLTLTESGPMCVLGADYDFLVREALKHDESHSAPAA